MYLNGFLCLIYTQFNRTSPTKHKTYTNLFLLHLLQNTLPPSITHSPPNLLHNPPAQHHRENSNKYNPPSSRHQRARKNIKQEWIKNQVHRHGWDILHQCLIGTEVICCGVHMQKQDRVTDRRRVEWIFAAARIGTARDDISLEIWV